MDSAVFAFTFVVAILTLLQGQQAPRTGVLQGVVTTQSSVNLPGTQITITDSSNKPVAQTLSTLSHS